MVVKIGGRMLNVFAYADDLVLLAPSWMHCDNCWINCISCLAALM